ncbi:Armadillo-type fold [Sesbania bispinosa]|nr:Armadillo-type fold [Sesbania bispinosa]
MHLRSKKVITLQIKVGESNGCQSGETEKFEQQIPCTFIHEDKQEHAVTALLNLSINDNNKTLIMEAGAIEPLIHVLQTGNDGAKENSAAALFSLSVLENNKPKIGRSGAVKALVDLLASGTLRGKKDAATALFNLSIFHENKARSQRGKENAASILLQLCLHSGKFCTLVLQEGAVPPLVALSQSGTPRAKEKAQQLLSHFRNQREGAMGKGKS